MKPLYILKIGGSVVTLKDHPGFSVRKELLDKVADSLLLARKKGKFDLILIHGAGALGHSLAKEYGLDKGVGKSARKMHGALLSRNANQKLDNAICEIFNTKGLPVAPVHTASVIIQKNALISKFETGMIKEALEKNLIPVMYGDMVFDTKLGMSVCSGDAIAPFLAKKFGARKIFFASDIAGVFTNDPHFHKDASLIEEISLQEITSNAKLSGSHNVDVTGGLWGKIKKMESLKKTNVEFVEIFNGLEEGNYLKALTGKKFPHTKIHIK
ncbi:MAG TPA: isopentenyl phosphate kinase [Patescibacteria group bacterium]